ncbi:hypothetical protein GCM10023340_09820 [Nocardioides marinquilinus]|uniref:Uncharacterized protein n=1 Tax=Nocardioides marinquilinus TaxID=1210400 RepID=A0ABP9PG31_9ACTN
MRSPGRASLVLTTLLALCTFAPAAQAETAWIDDPNADGMVGSSLDIGGVLVANNDDALNLRVRVREVTHGDLAVWVEPKWSSKPTGAPFYIFASRHRESGTYSERYYPRDEQPCRGLRFSWQRHKRTVSIRIPSSCIFGGNYDALRVRLITEVDGDDADVAPGTPSGDWPYSRLVRRR